MTNDNCSQELKLLSGTHEAIPYEMICESEAIPSSNLYPDCIDDLWVVLNQLENSIESNRESGYSDNLRYHHINENVNEFLSRDWKAWAKRERVKNKRLPVPLPVHDNTHHGLNLKPAMHTLNEYMPSWGLAKGAKPPTSLDYVVNKCSEKNNNEFWTDLLLAKQDDIIPAGVEGTGITRDSISDALSAHGVSMWVTLAFRNCCKSSAVWVCENNDCSAYSEPKYTPTSCNNKCCPLCNRNRERKLLPKFEPLVKAMKFPKLLTLTCGHLEGKPSPKIVSYYAKKARKLIQDLWGRSAFSTFRCPQYSPDGHLHFHIIIDTPRYIPQKTISDKWRELTDGKFYVVDIRKVRSTKAWEYAIRYAVRAPEFESSDMYAEFYLLFYGRRMFSASGDLYNLSKKIKNIKHKKECQCCHETLTYVGVSLAYQHEFMLKVFGTWQKVP